MAGQRTEGGGVKDPREVVEVRCPRCGHPTWMRLKDRGAGDFICANCAITERDGPPGDRSKQTLT